MCGIVGYIGSGQAVDFIVPGLRHLEYRGYDSSGILAVEEVQRFSLVKAAGRIDRLSARLTKSPAPGHLGIGHTRWATHGAPTDENAHPHLGGNQILAIGHNGVIENYRTLNGVLI